ncbi:hypothetical protein PVAND_008432 [Polypedilum vanderplanki]|uniref:Uncharacterized protein n=1 Tax=Polypedilum vanderplanki TaxID=319348 RepID=A0A9J6CA80_POLVA|nr:hypothetical protein PVAND_008432 [Polypedilum vanderplanki]
MYCAKIKEETIGVLFGFHGWRKIVITGSILNIISALDEIIRKVEPKNILISPDIIMEVNSAMKHFLEAQSMSHPAIKSASSSSSSSNRNETSNYTLPRFRRFWNSNLKMSSVNIQNSVLLSSENQNIPKKHDSNDKISLNDVKNVIEEILIDKKIIKKIEKFSGPKIKDE